MTDSAMQPVAAAPTPTTVLVLGLGESGFAAARWLARQPGVQLRLADTRAEPLAWRQASQLPADVQWQLGAPVSPEWLAGVDRVIIGPGLSPADAGLAALLAEARQRALPVLSDLDLFFEALAALPEPAPAVLGITGTNGKTTVTSLTTHLLNAAGVTARAAGNIGPAAMAALVAALDEDALPAAWVLELSSFQLAFSGVLPLTAAVVLNVDQDHLDWHGTIEAYAEAKARIYAGAACQIINRDDALVSAMVPVRRAMNVRSFGLEAPVAADDLGLSRDGGMVWLAEGLADPDVLEAQAAPRRRTKGEVIPAPQRPDAASLRRLMPVDALRIRGPHNQANAQAALLLARAVGLPWAPLLHAVREYAGEPHRLQWLRSVAGVDYIEDSKATNVAAALAALRAVEQRVVLIAGGDGKGQDFRPLAAAVQARARAVLLIGRDAPALAAALAETGVPLESVGELTAAVSRAAALAQPGDAVLLSPACASLDQFQDYKARAACFDDAVRELALDQGELA